MIARRRPIGALLLAVSLSACGEQRKPPAEPHPRETVECTIVESHWRPIVACLIERYVRVLSYPR